jgi:hypothetical protein
VSKPMIVAHRKDFLNKSLMAGTSSPPRTRRQ